MIRGLQELYRHRCHEGGNLNEHLPLLYMLSLESNGVAEFGIDRGISTSAILAGQEERALRGWPASYLGVDVNAACEAEVQRLCKIRTREFPAAFIKASSVTIPAIAPVDLLFIDSLHTEATIRAELAIHLGSVRKWIAMHDTVAFGENGEQPGTRGLLYGIDALLQPEWIKVYDSPRNNGLAVFRRA